MEVPDDSAEQKRGLIQVASQLVGGVSNDGDALELARAEKKKKIIKFGLIGLLIVGLILAIVLPLTLKKNPDNPPSPPTPPTPPLEYYNPYVIDPKSVQVFPSRTTGIISVPSGYNPEHHSYVFKRLLSKMRGGNSSNSTYGVDSRAIPVGVNNKLIRNLNFTFTQNTWRVSKLTIRDNDTDRYSIPDSALGNPGENRDMRLDMVGFRMADKGTFDFQFSDPLTQGNQYLNTTNCSLVFMDKFIQMDFNLPSQNLYGFGERIHEFGLKEGAWNMWAHGQPSPYDDGLSGRKGGYGVHPFILIQGKNKDDFYGMYFRNSNAMTPIITFYENPFDGSKTSKLTYITTGGQLEIYFFIHGSAMDIIKKYQDVMGAKPKLPPFWSLGWMQASYKWSNQDMVENVLAQYKANNFPLDTIFLDIPYMLNYTDFTVNTTAFNNISGLVNSLHANKQQIVPIIDAGISAEDTNNTYYAMGNNDDIFIKSGLYKSEKYNNNLINQVWPKITVFVDWFNEKSTKMWFRGLQDLYNQFAYDGIWIDMNEPYGFQTAEMDPANPVPIPIPIDGAEQSCRHPRYLEQENSDSKNYSWYKTFDQGENSTWYLPFLPDFGNYQSYDNHSISLNATNPSINQTQYNVHSFYGHMMARRTSEYFDVVKRNQTDPRFDKRNFILTRSTFTSTGQYASHWLGDNYREYKYMNYSISGTMNMNMFGIPHVGADIGGFFGRQINPELMAKWAQLGTFYPFARFHYDIHSPENEPYKQPEPYASIIRRTMFDRYQYSRELYTCLFIMSKYGGSCFSPLFYSFPNDTKLYEQYESSFIFANAIKVTPNLLENSQSIPAYFPYAKGKWVSLVNTREILSGNTSFTLDTTGYSTPAHLMPGKIISFQNNSDASINNIHQLINGSITVLVNPDDNDFAEGSIFLDQGESQNELSQSQYEFYSLQFSQKSIQFLIPEGNPGTQPGYSLESIKILNGERFKDNDIACYLDSKTLAPNPLVARWIEEEAVLRIYNEVGAPLKFSDIHSVHFSNDQEFNICDPKHFQYKVADGKTPILDNQTSVSIDLVHGPGILPDVTVKLSIHAGNIINLGWTYKFDQSRTGKKMFKVPDEYVSANQIPLQGDLSQFVLIRTSPFQMKFLYQDQAQTEFFGIDSLVYDDYLNWVKMHVVTEQGDKFRGIFGLGERANFNFFIKDGVYSLWAKDIPTPIDEGKFPAANLYGVHPYFMFKHKIGSWVGILYNLAAAQDWWIKNDQTNGLVNLQTVAVGGRVDLYIIMGSTPEQVQSKYLSLIGKPVLIPQWGLGWNQCRYGYRTLDVLKGVLQGYRSNNIPLDVMWSDIDYMKDYRNFIYDDEVAYKGLPDFINSLHTQGMRYVPLIDAGTSARPLPIDNYTQYQDGLQKDVFLKIQGETFIGQVWPNDAAFPDFFDPVAIKWWQDNLDSMHKLLPFDGLWLDMNEFSNFCNGVCYQKQAPSKSIKTNLKYTPTGKDLEWQNTVPLDTQHKNGDYQLDTHSITGISEIKVTNEWFTNSLKTRTFIIERSSSVGLGKWASRWLGDNFSDQKFMQLSVSGIMLSNMFGIPLVGADICGFLGDTTEDLCIKWHFVGAFYPFSRNHNGGFVAQEPYVWSNTAMLAMTDAIKIKYALVKYYYTELFALSTKDGEGTFYKPLFFEFPEDYNATNRIDFNVMLGSALKLSINSGSIYNFTTDFYFPQGTWCRLLGNTKGENCFTAGQQGMTKNYPSDLTDYQLHLREGYTVPLQDTFTQSAKAFNTTKDLQNQYVDFHALGSVTDIQSGKWVSQGRYINDDGLSLNISGNYNSYILHSSFDGVDTLTVSFGMDAQATLHLVPETGCYLVNQNDLLGGMFFYNAEKLGLKSSFDVTVMFQSGSTNQFKATYDDVNDRLAFDVQGAHVCMSIIQQIKLVRSK